MKKAILLLILLALIACSKSQSGWKTIEIEHFLMDVPQDFNIKFERGIDTQPGKIQGNELSLSFDYGYFTDTLVSTPQEYLKAGRWRDRSAIMFMSSKIPYDGDFMHIKVLNLRRAEKNDSSLAKGCDYVANCSFKEYHFKLPVIIPQEIKNYIVKVDTLKHNQRRIVKPAHGTKGVVGIYMGDERRSIFNRVNYSTIVVGAENINIKQQELALKIFNTLRPKGR